YAHQGELYAGLDSQATQSIEWVSLPWPAPSAYTRHPAPPVPRSEGSRVRQNAGTATRVLANAATIGEGTDEPHPGPPGHRQPDLPPGRPCPGSAVTGPSRPGTAGRRPHLSDPFLRRAVCRYR